MTQPILKALAQLDAKNDAHWTADGAPRLETLKFLMAGETVTREQVNAAAPGFSRANNTLAAPQTDAGAAAGAGGGAGTGTTESAAPSDGSTPPTQPQVNDSQQPPQANDDERDDVVGDGTGAPPEAESEVTKLKLGSDEALEDAQEFYEYARKRKEEAEAEFEKARTALDAQLDERTKLGKNETFTSQVGDYLKSQQAIRQGKARAIQEVQEMRRLGLNVAAETKSKLDKAFERKTARGAQRPVHPTR